MKSLLRLTAAACVLAGLAAERASADITYKLNATLGFDSLAATGQDAGELWGEFTTNDARTQLISANIYASAATVQLTQGWLFIPALYFTFEETEYTDDNSDVLAILGAPLVSDSLTFFKPSAHNAEETLFLLFQGRLNATGETLLQSLDSHWLLVSSETQEGKLLDYTRFVTSGGVEVVPEPSTIAVAAICAPALLAYGWRRRRKAMEAA